MPPATADRARRKAGEVLDRLRRLPWLTRSLFAAGLVVFAVLLRGGLSRLPEGASFLPLEHMVRDAAQRGMWLEWVRHHWGLGSLCLLPALVSAVLRVRGRALLVPVAVGSGWLALYWLATDVLQHYHHTLDDPLGMEPSPAAYWWKAGLMTSLLLSPPVLLWLYWRATLLDRYLLRTFAVPFLLCTGGLSAMMISMDLLNNLARYSEHGMGPWALAGHFLGQMPFILMNITEVSLLMAVLFSLGKMSRHNEVTAMAATGRSFFRMLLPLLVFGLWCAFALTAMNFHLAPEAYMAKEKLQEARGGGTSTSATGVIYRNRNDFRTWQIHHVPYQLREGDEMQEVTVIQQDAAGGLRGIFFARRALWFPATGEWRLTGVTRFDPGPAGRLRRSETGLVTMSREQWPETPGGMLQDRLETGFMGVPSLLATLHSSALPPLARARYETALHWRFALPFRTFLIVLVAAPLGVVAARRKDLFSGVARAFGIFFFIFFAGTLALKAGEGGYVPPVLAAWTVNAIFAVAGVLLFLSRTRLGRPRRA